MDLNDKNIKLLEVFNTWQGEGVNCGRQMLVTRFKYCDRFCKMCDTWIKMKTSSEGSYSINDINESLKKTMGLMVTGGEPTFETDQIHNLTQTIQMINLCHCQIINVETNGCNIEKLLTAIDIRLVDNRTAKIINVMYSPKIFSEKEYMIERERTSKVIHHPDVYLKVVADGNTWSDKYIRELSKCEDKGKVYLMPLGTTPEEIVKNWEYCVNIADECNLNISSRIHIMHSFS